MELQAQLPLVNVRPVFCGDPPKPKDRHLRRAAKWLVRQVGRFLGPRPAVTAVSSLTPSGPWYPFELLPERFVNALCEELIKGVDLCQAEFAPMLSLGSWLPKNIPKLFIHHQIHFMYSRRFLEVNGSNAYLDYVDAQWNLHERSYLQQFDGVVTFSGQDSEILAGCVPPRKLFVSPFPMPYDIGISLDAPARFDGRFLFIGSREHSPNHDALEWLLADIWPEMLRRRPSSRMVVIGDWSGSDRAKYAATGVIFSGFVKDLAPVLRGGIMLVPLRIGSGIRTKILAAMAQGVPVVSTSVGCEGLQVRPNQDLLVCDSFLGFAEAAVELGRDPESWRRLAVAGKAAAEEHYSPETVRRRRNEIYARLSASKLSIQHGEGLEIDSKGT